MRFLLFPLSLIYLTLTSIRNLLFDYKILPSKSYNIPIICVGNLCIGGAGKTPHAKYIINILKEKYNIAILSRGYGRDSSNFQYVKTNSLANKVGDEPLLIKKNYPECLVVVEKNRNKGVKRILKDFPETQVIILDDGFQHRWIKAGLNIIITPYSNPYFSDYLIPAGKLREKKEGAVRSDIIIISKTPTNIHPKEKISMINNLNLIMSQSAYFSSIKYQEWKSLHTNNILKKNNEKYNITLVTGIANAQPLIDHLYNEGHKIHHIKYPDHYKYNTKDIKNILTKHNANTNTKKLILTTEKDAVKLRDFMADFNLQEVYFTSIEIILKENIKFEKQILNYVEKN